MTLTFEEARKLRFLRVDTYNALKSVEQREIESLYSGKSCVLFIDTYDLISHFFPNGLLFYNEHAPMMKLLFTEAFLELKPEDPIKISITPTSFLEFFYLLERTAFKIWSKPPIKKEDLQILHSESELERVLRPYMNDLAVTDNLLESSDVPRLKYIEDIMKLIKQKKIINSSEAYNYMSGSWDKFYSYTTLVFDAISARKVLTTLRERYKNYWHKYPDTQEDMTYIDMGLDDFSISVDLTNVRQTAYINSVAENTDYSLISHGINLLKATSMNWIGDQNDIPVKHSIIALLLPRILHSQRTLNDAKAVLHEVCQAIYHFLEEMHRILKENEEFWSYVNKPKKYQDLAAKEIERSDELLFIDQYIQKYCAIALLNSKKEYKTKLDIGITKVSPERDKIIEYARDEKKIKQMGEKLLEGGRKALKQLFDAESVLDIYYPPDEVTMELLAKYKGGYSFGDFRK